MKIDTLGDRVKINVMVLKIGLSMIFISTVFKNEKLENLLLRDTSKCSKTIKQGE